MSKRSLKAIHHLSWEIVVVFGFYSISKLNVPLISNMVSYPNHSSWASLLHAVYQYLVHIVGDERPNSSNINYLLICGCYWEGSSLSYSLFGRECFLWLWHSIGFHLIFYNMSRVMRKPAFCICENKGADQLRSNCAADQRLCFRYTGSTILLLSESEISSL